jgi:hypothetical protein
LIKRSPRIVGDIYTGFDTEYVTMGWYDNKFLSAQLSITQGVKLIIPISRDFVFEGVNTLTGENYLKTGPNIGMKHEMELTIRECIKSNVKNLYGGHFSEMYQAINGLITIRETLDNIKITNSEAIFQFKKSPIKNVLILPAENEELKINFNSLIHIINRYVTIECEKTSVSLLLKEMQKFNNDQLDFNFNQIVPS